MQRHLIHLKVEQGGNFALLPVVMLFQTDDVDALNSVFDDVVDDMIWIVRLHAGSILPMSGSASRPVYGATPLDPKTGIKTVYHGNTISASFTVREPEANYAVLAFGDEDATFEDMPVASFRLHAHVRHKEAEAARKAATAKAMESMDVFVVREPTSACTGARAKPASPVSGKKRKAP